MVHLPSGQALARTSLIFIDRPLVACRLVSMVQHVKGLAEPNVCCGRVAHLQCFNDSPCSTAVNILIMYVITAVNFLSAECELSAFIRIHLVNATSRTCPPSSNWSLVVAQIKIIEVCNTCTVAIQGIVQVVCWCDSYQSKPWCGIACGVTFLMQNVLHCLIG